LGNHPPSWKSSFEITLKRKPKFGKSSIFLEIILWNNPKTEAKVWEIIHLLGNQPFEITLKPKPKFGKSSKLWTALINPIIKPLLQCYKLMAISKNDLPHANTRHNFWHLTWKILVMTTTKPQIRKLENFTLQPTGPLPPKGFAQLIRPENNKYCIWLYMVDQTLNQNRPLAPSYPVPTYGQNIIFHMSIFNAHSKDWSIGLNNFQDIPNHHEPHDK